MRSRVWIKRILAIVVLVLIALVGYWVWPQGPSSRDENEFGHAASSSQATDPLSAAGMEGEALAKSPGRARAGQAGKEPTPALVARPGETAQIVIEAAINNHGDEAVALGRLLSFFGHLTGFQLGSTLGSAMTETSNGQSFTTREVTRSFTGQAGHWDITRTEPQANGTTEDIFFSPTSSMSLSSRAQRARQALPIHRPNHHSRRPKRACSAP